MYRLWINKKQVSDIQILKDIDKGDKEAWVILYDKYYQKIIKYISRQYSKLSIEEIEDIYSEACEDIFIIRQLDNKKEIINLYAYLYQICTNKAFKITNDKERLPIKSLSSFYVVEDKDDNGNEYFIPEMIEEESSKEIVLTTLENSLEEMGESCKQILKLYYYTNQKQSWEDVADKMGIEPASARNKGMNCRKELKLIFDKRFKQVA